MDDTGNTGTKVYNQFELISVSKEFTRQIQSRSYEAENMNEDGFNYPERTYQSVNHRIDQRRKCSYLHVDSSVSLYRSNLSQ